MRISSFSRIVIVDSLGSGQQLFDFLESSRWGKIVTSVDIEESLRSTLFSRFTWRSLPQGDDTEGKSVNQGINFAEQTNKFLDLARKKVAVFGVHGATALDPVTFLSEVYGDTFEVTYHGFPCVDRKQAGNMRLKLAVKKSMTKVRSKGFL